MTVSTYVKKYLFLPRCSLRDKAYYFTQTGLYILYSIKGEQSKFYSKNFLNSGSDIAATDFIDLDAIDRKVLRRDSLRSLDEECPNILCCHMMFS